MILSKISIIIPTRDRPKNLQNLLLAISNQSILPFEVIIVDDSPTSSAKNVVQNFVRISRDLTIIYVSGNGEGLPTARNIGLKKIKGDAVLFLDDDTIPDLKIIETLKNYLDNNPSILGIQPEILNSSSIAEYDGLIGLENSFNKFFMLSYKKKNTLSVRKSGSSIFPNQLTLNVLVDRMFGCCCYRAKIFQTILFDQNLKRWGFMEDLDFSFRVLKKYPKSFILTKNSKIVHKPSIEARLPSRIGTRMTIIYWCYIFFKDFFESSTLNLLAFFWALTGTLISAGTKIFLKKGKRYYVQALVYTIISYTLALKNLKSIISLNLDFFNKELQ